VFKLNNNRNLPTRTYKDRLTIGSGNDRIELYHFGPGHTGGDTFVVFPADHVMATGDTFSNKNLPNIDTNNGGGAIGLTKSLAQAAKLRGIDTVIQGHGGQALAFQEFQEYAQFNADFMKWAEKEKKAGKSVDEAAAEYKTPDQYKGYDTPQPARIKRNLQDYYDEFAKQGSH
jgi:glyoxylase-like metal-dependent hydrolase (beta-lactamase superfamily II)